MRLFVAVGVLSLLALPPVLSSADPPTLPADAPAPRPKVGLALSGGGARGAAHAGVLRVLEELNVPIDYIAGTSIGAIVGGLYASGRSLEEIEEVVATTDWDDIFSDTSRREELSFRRKQDDAQVLSRIRVGVERGKPALPPGLISGQKVNKLLQKLMLPTVRIDSFDELPIPFRAVATDLATGEMVVLDRGSLSAALRASMSIPGVFAPLPVGDRRLLDGGLVRNLPIDVVRRMGAEIVIAVDISTPLDDPETIRTLFGVTSQMSAFQTRNNVLEQIRTLGPRDILITPELPGITTSSFSRDQLELAVKQGEVAARLLADDLARLSVPAAEYAERTARDTIEQRPVFVRRIEVENESRLDTRVLLERLRVQPDSPLDLDLLAEDLAQLYDLDAFQLVDFLLLPIEDEADHYDLRIIARERMWGRHYLRFGLNLISDLSGYGEFTAVGLLTMTQLNGLGAEWKTYGAVGTRPALVSEFYQPLDFRGRFFVAPAAGWLRSPFLVGSGESTINDFEVDRAFVGIDLGVQFGRYAELRLGPVQAWRDATLRSGDLDVEKSESDPFGVRLQFEWDTLDSINFPRRGAIARLEALATSGGGIDDDGFQKVELTAGFPISWGRNTIVPGLRGGWSGGAPTGYDQFSLGGFLNLSGYSVQRYFGTRLALARLLYYRQLLVLPSLLGSGVFVGGGVEAAWCDEPVAGEPTDGWIPAATAFVGADTLLGPLYLGYGVTEKGEDSFYLFLGRIF